MKKSLVFVVPFLLAGCGNYSSVKIPYFLPAGGGIIETRRALSSLYISLKYPPQPEESFLGNIVGNLLNDPAAEFNNYALAEKIAGVFSGPGGKVLAYRVSRSTGDGDPYVKYFNPSGVLELKLSDPRFSVEKEDRSSEYYDKNRQRQTVKSTVWVYQAYVGAEIKLYSGSYVKALDTAHETFGCAEERSDAELSPAEWYAENEDRILNDAAVKLYARYIGREVLRSRVLFRKKGDKESAKASDLARRGKWAGAEEIWSRRLSGKNDWRDALGLAVSAEVRKDYSAARDYYLRAREASAGDKEALSTKWGEILEDLEVMLDTGSAAAQASGEDWFAPEAAVLPFTDETTSIDGPPMLRAIIADALKTAGYRVQALEDTDKILLARGFTQGGQLGAADRAELCKWLGVERLFYGDITDFGEIMAGVYNRRMIKGSVTLWDLKAGDFIWGISPSVVRVSTSKSFFGGIFFQLAKGMAERMKNKPLAYEGTVFAGKVIEALPNKIR
ncbi:MAG: hypothetical protein A2270_00190 [Elusimicrobia bacterium RIFOXYA12_FULL_51_18]|nr:MAG: hypothetical protein A2270_00190 [Elusimicrobia bacterium RIFOXYA12_FULL_51_18]OGS31515.1 MAG: hypothetical protein A2218_09660 [Elusimicrobia bacterium RIFOXYA2_FULL_53_38]